MNRLRYTSTVGQEIGYVQGRFIPLREAGINPLPPHRIRFGQEETQI